MLTSENAYRLEWREDAELVWSFRLLSPRHSHNFLLLKIKTKGENDSPSPQNSHHPITLSPSLDFHLPLWLFSSRWVCTKFDLLVLGLAKIEWVPFFFFLSENTWRLQKQHNRRRVWRSFKIIGFVGSRETASQSTVLLPLSRHLSFENW